MEGRVGDLASASPVPRVRGLAPGRGIAAATLLLILVITAGWWALALYPVGETAPGWVVRTRAACFGSVGSGLPSAGGWVLLVGEPLGMIGTLVAVWGRALSDDLAWIGSRATGRVALVGVALGVLWGNVAAAQRVLRALGIGATDGAAFEAQAATLPVARLDRTAPALVLTDQRGETFDLAAWRDRPVIVTFAFAHCADVCPTLVHQLREARRGAERPNVPIVIVTLDPWRDVPARLPHIAQQWGLDGVDRILSGPVDAVNLVLDAWGVGRARDADTGDISHAAVAFLVDGEGRLTARLDGGIDRMRDVLRER